MRIPTRTLGPVLGLSVALCGTLACRSGADPERAPTAAPTDPARPNVLLIYGDDVGWGDLGCYGAELVPTPHLDRLASEGLRFTDAHCSAATCTPSRFSLLSGVHGFRHGVRVLPPNAPLTLPTDGLTLSDVFHDAGYATAVVGKWHLGLGAAGEPVDWNGEVAPGPLELGFDHSFLLPSTNDRVPCVYLEGHRVVDLDASDPLFVGKRPEGVACTTYPNGKQDRAAMTYYPSSHGHDDSVVNGIGRIGTMWGGSHALWDDETMADVFVAEALAWLDARPQDRPFFLYFSSQDIHVPRAPHPRFQGATALGYRGDAMVALDAAVGALLAALDERGLREDTLVIFSSDNGPVYDDGYEDGTVVLTSTEEVDQGHDGSGPWRGGKYQIFEGGTRVPFLVRWPGRVPAGEVSDALFGQIDLLASFASMFGRTLADDEAIDSRDALAALLGEDREGVPFLIEEARTVALRVGDWKWVHRGDGGELYDLATDVGEARDVAAENPERAAAMRAHLDELRADGAGVR